MEPQQKPKFKIIQPKDNKITKRQIKGDSYLKILDKVRSIVLHQKMHFISNGIKGFIFHGDVGIGKTLTAKAVANELGAPLVFIDGSDIARKFYGESESQISNIFEESKKHRFAVILIDDCESVFPTRDWQKSEAWHFAQNNVFFHQLDNIDTSRNVVILTTNRFDLIDKAVKDRLYSIVFPLPTKKNLHDIAKYKCGQLKMEPGNVYKLIDEGKVRTVRDLEKFAMEIYIEEVLRKKCEPTGGSYGVNERKLYK